jgi:hypothetical protein
MDLESARRTLVAMRAPADLGGGDMYSTWTFIGVVPHARIAYVFNFADQHGNRLVPDDLGLPHRSPTNGDHLATFGDLGDGRTRGKQ